MGDILRGVEIASQINEEVAKEVAELKKRGISPTLATILVGEDTASKIYVSQKHKTANLIGIESQRYELAADTPQEEVIAIIEKLNADPKVHGILIQLPLPAHLNATQLINKILPIKDVDCFHPINISNFFIPKSFQEILQSNLYLPCTPYGIIELLRRNNIPIAGKHVVILGRSNIVGKPAAILFLANDATVTICHTKTQNLKSLTLQGDILVVSIGKPKFIKKDFVKMGAVVIDVGINRTEKGLVGDVDFEQVEPITSYITPVPGGVGPMTVAMLMLNTLKAAYRQSNER